MEKNIITLVVSLWVLLIPLSIFSQTGPGGVGTTDGSSTLEIWLMGNAGVTSSGTEVTNWDDQSGNNFSFASIIGSRPSVVSNGLNNNNTILFDASNTEYLDYSPSRGSYSQTASDYTMIFVLKKGGAIDPTGAIFSTSISTTNSTIEVSGDGNAPPANFEISGSGANTYTVDATSNYNSFAIMNITRTSSPSHAFSFYRNGGSVGSASTSSGIATEFTDPLSLGIDRPGTGFFDGEIAEVIIYYEALNEAKRNILDNYLAVKYGLTISNDKYSETNGHVYDVIGIGNGSGEEHTQSKLGGLVLNEHPTSGFSSGDYIFAAHDNSTGISTLNINSPVLERWNRDWYIESTNTPDVEIGFDFSDGGFANAPLNVANYRLLFRPTLGSNFVEVTTSTSFISGDQMFFQVSSGNFADGFYTLGSTDPTTSPLPVTFVNFSSQIENEVTVLNWQTATEENSWYFEVQKSSDGKLFSPIGEVSANGTSTSLKNYRFEDASHKEGLVYYRLKQVDFNGNFELSRVISANKTTTADETAGIYFENPVSEESFHIFLEGNENISLNVKIADHSGRTMDVRQVEIINGKGVVNVKDLQKGYYTIFFESENLLKREKLIIN